MAAWNGGSRLNVRVVVFQVRPEKLRGACSRCRCSQQLGGVMRLQTACRHPEQLISKPAHVNATCTTICALLVTACSTCAILADRSCQQGITWNTFSLARAAGFCPGKASAARSSCMHASMNARSAAAAVRRVNAGPGRGHPLSLTNEESCGAAAKQGKPKRGQCHLQ